MKFTLITGASRGIGKALAEEFAGRGFNLILIARTEEKLKKLASSLKDEYGIEAFYFVQDLNEKSAPEKILDWCLQNKYAVNILVNNVGHGLHGYFPEMKKDDLHKILRLNIESITMLIYTFIPELRKYSGAHILNVSSTAAFQPVPYLAIYAASKAYINSFSGGLREELKEYGINVSCLAPGPTDSDFFNKSGVGKGYDLSSVKMAPEEVAKSGLDGLFNKKALIIPGVSNKVGAFFSKRISSVPIVKLLGKMFKPESHPKS